MEIRCAKTQDVDAIAHLEAVCFPQAEAATRESIEERVKAYPNHFFLLWDGDQLVSFVNGLVTDQPDLTDEMYEKADMHQEDGAWQMIFGVDTDPHRRKQGLAGQAIEPARRPHQFLLRQFQQRVGRHHQVAGRAIGLAQIPQQQLRTLPFCR